MVGMACRGPLVKRLEHFVDKRSINALFSLILIYININKAGHKQKKTWMFIENNAIKARPIMIFPFRFMPNVFVNHF